MAQEQGKHIRVYADETRPLLQGARLTAWELMRAGIDVTLICDNMAAQVMKEGRIDLVMVGADRVAANGDSANKIGTYGVAVLAQAHRIPFYVLAPSSTFDLKLVTGDAYPLSRSAVPRKLPAGLESERPRNMCRCMLPRLTSRRPGSSRQLSVNKVSSCRLLTNPWNRRWQALVNLMHAKLR